MMRASDATEPGALDQASDSMVWLLVGQVYAKLVGFLSYFVMVGYLSPEDVGLVALCWLAIAFGDTFFDIGLTHAYVRDGRRVHREESTLFWAVGGLALAWIILAFAVGSLLASILDVPAIAPVTAALSAIYAFKALGATQLSIQIVERRVAGITAREAVAATAGAATGVGLAMAGFGHWALVARLVCLPAISNMLAMVTTRWRPAFTFDRRWFGEKVRFGLPLTAATNAHWLLVLQIEGYLVGHSLGLTALGIIQFAKKPTEVLSQTMTAIQRVHLLRSLSAAARSPEGWGTELRRTMILFAVLGGVAALASLGFARFVVEPVWGAGWTEGIPSMSVLALSAPFVTVQAVAASALIALGALGSLFRANMLGAGVTCIALWVGTHFGTLSVAWALSLSLGVSAFVTLIALRTNAAGGTVLMRDQDPDAPSRDRTDP